MTPGPGGGSKGRKVDGLETGFSEVTYRTPSRAGSGEEEHWLQLLLILGGNDVSDSR